MSADSLYQVIHDHRTQPPRQYLFTANRVLRDWGLQLFTPHGDDDLRVWTGVWMFREADFDKEVVEAAINAGLLHVEKGHSRVDDVMMMVVVSPPDEEPLCFHLRSDPKVNSHGSKLLDAAFKLQARLVVDVDRSEMRLIRAQLSEKDAEIASLRAKLASIKATVARSTGGDNKKLVSPQKKAPANASALQPNAKRRKVVEDEFAGSSDDDM
ncbi:MAG: hypothetical protein TREMPRED_005095 [Tremellales sp. Tagirdzhanova-0007]|nr:MAG: hypothetical protein TREMPRED_005095 [Tremellales sp. Tagirdzhanova-0007]